MLMNVKVLKQMNATRTLCVQTLKGPMSAAVSVGLLVTEEAVQVRMKSYFFHVNYTMLSSIKKVGKDARRFHEDVRHYPTH